MNGGIMPRSRVEKSAIVATIVEAINTLRINSPRIVTIDSIAMELAKNGNVTAKQDAESLYGRAVITLRALAVRVVPTTKVHFDNYWMKGIEPVTEAELASCIAGLAGHGRGTYALYFPETMDDLIYVAALLGRMDSGAGKVVAVTSEAKGAANETLLSTGAAQAVLDRQPKRTGLQKH